MGPEGLLGGLCLDGLWAVLQGVGHRSLTCHDSGMVSHQGFQQALNRPFSSLISPAAATQQCNAMQCNVDVTGKADSNSSIGYEGLWRAHIRGTMPGGGAGEPQARPPVPSQGYGSSLSTSDMEGVARFLEEFAVRALLPHLEVRVRNLNHQVRQRCNTGQDNRK